MSRIPLEIYEMILYELQDETKSLKACSLSSSFLTPLCQQYLLARVTIGHPKFCCKAPYKISGTPAELKHLLKISPNSAFHMRTLAIYDSDIRVAHDINCQGVGWSTYVSRLEEDRHIPDILPLLTRLVALKVAYHSWHNNRDGTWSGLPTRFLQAIVKLLHLPSLTSVDIEDGPTFSLLQAGGSNIKNLTLDFLTVRRNRNCEELTLNPPHTILLESLKTKLFYDPAESGLPLLEALPSNVSLVTLKKLDFSGYCRSDGIEGLHTQLISLLMKCANSLEVLVYRPPNIVNELASEIDHFNEPIDLSSLKALRRLELWNLEVHIIYNSGVPVDGTVWLVNLLQRSSSANEQLQKIMLNVRYVVRQMQPPTFEQFRDYFLNQWNEVAVVLSNVQNPKLKSLQVNIKVDGHALAVMVAELGSGLKECFASVGLEVVLGITIR